MRLPGTVVATLDGMTAIDTLLAALEPLARPATAEDPRSGGQRRADALTELARRAWRGGGCLRPVGFGPS
jgi:Domain of unknown function (DUF222)